MASYTLTIDGADRTTCVVARSLKIKDGSDSEPSIAHFAMENRDGNGNPSGDEEVIITDDSSNKLFAGRILKLNPVKVGSVVWDIECVDYNRDLDRNLVVESYQDMTDAEIISDIIENYAPDFTVTNVEADVTIDQISFNYMPPSQCFEEICGLTGRSWYVDYDKDIHYFAPADLSAPFNITSTSTNYKRLRLNQDHSAIRNRVYVRGGNKLSDSTTITMKADGEQTVFGLPEKPHNFSMTVGGTSKTVGIKNVDAAADYDYLLNYQEKYVECGNDSAPAVDTVMSFTYKYNIPILVAIEDKDSIEEFGQFEYAIFDNKIETTEQARTRASAELTDYADTLVSGSFVTTTTGFVAGQTININLSDMGVNEDFVVKSVEADSLGGGQFEYTIKITSAKQLGIINFLIKMLEADKNQLEITDDEVVDELSSVTGESFTITFGTPTLTSHSGSYKYDSDADWDLSEWIT